MCILHVSTCKDNATNDFVNRTVHAVRGSMMHMSICCPEMGLLRSAER